MHLIPTQPTWQVADPACGQSWAGLHLDDLVGDFPHAGLKRQRAATSPRESPSTSPLNAKHLSPAWALGRENGACTPALSSLHESQDTCDYKREYRRACKHQSRRLPLHLTRRCCGASCESGFGLGSMLNLEECQLPTQISYPCPTSALPLTSLSTLILLKTKPALCRETISLYDSF